MPSAFLIGSGAGLTSMVFGGVYKNVLSLNGSVNHHLTWTVLSGMLLIPLACVNYYDSLHSGAAGLYSGVTAAAFASLSSPDPNMKKGLFCKLCPMFNLICTLMVCGFATVRSQ